MKKNQHNLLKILSLFLSIFLIGSLFPSISFSKSLQMEIQCKPGSIALEGQSISVFVTTNEDAILTVNATSANRVFSIFTNIPLERSIKKEFRIPIVYPLNAHFTLQIRADNIETHSSVQETIDFTVEKKKMGLYSIEGRILNGSYVHKTGLEGAFIEVVSGESYAYTETGDDGYFSLDHLIQGPYKLRVTHPCTKSTKEFIADVNANTEFANVTLHPHKIPDFDFWMNKPAGSNYERSETATIYIRSRLNMKVHLYVHTKKEKTPILLNFHVAANQISRFYWSIPEELPLEPITFSLEPAEEGFCGSANYTVLIRNAIQKGSLSGTVLVDGKPIAGAKVFFPYEYLPHAFTDEFGTFVLKDIPGGSYHLRCTMPGFLEYNLPLVDIIRGQSNGPLEIDLEVDSPTKISFHPARLNFTTHERREKQIPIVCSLKEGYIKNIRFEKKEGPDGISLTPATIPQMLQETQILFFTIANTVPPGEYAIRYEIYAEDKLLQELHGNVSILGLSYGTFDGIISPPGNSIPQGGTADYVFHAERFTNFREPLSLRFHNLPSYTQVIMDTEKQYIPPCSIPFSIDTSLSTEVKTHEIEVEVLSKTQKNMYICPLTVFPKKGQLVTCPKEGWDPILTAGERASISISCFSPHGHSNNVRINKDFGPDWITIPNKEIGTVTQTPVSTQVQFSPPADVLVGGYPYSVSFTYGDNNEEFKKFTGQIHVLPHDPDTPVNARGKFIQEEQSLIITWNPPTDKQDQIIGYNIYRSLHYPALANSAPYNATLLKDTEYIDKDFLYGQEYWYVVKAVYQDGTLSPPSNTVQIIVPPQKHGIVIVTLDKPMGSSYYTGTPVSINFQSSLSGKVSVVCNSGFLNITLLETVVKKGTRYHWKPILPDLPEAKSMCNVYFEGEGGYAHTKKFSFFTTKQTKGASSIYGFVYNKLTDKPIEGATIHVSSGPSYATATTDETGAYLLKYLSPGSYQLSVNYNGDIFSPFSCNVEAGENTLDRIDIETKQNDRLLAWTSSIEQELLPLWLYAQEDDLVTLYWAKDQIQRVCHRHIEVKKKQTTYLQLRIMEDLPPGKNYLLIESEKYHYTITIPVSVPKPQSADRLYGYVKNRHGIPLQNASINETLVNEWGYFNIKASTDLDSLKIQAPYYQTRTIDQSDFQPGTAILLEPLTGSISHSQQEVFINKDFNAFTFQWVSEDGWTEIKNFQIVKESEEESEIIYSLPSLQCNPSTLYEFEYMNILRDEVIEGSYYVTWTTNSAENDEDSIYKIPIKKGLDDKLFLSIHPSIPIFSDPSSIEMILDIYSYASRPSDYLLRSKLPDAFAATIKPSELIPGNQCNMVVQVKENTSLTKQLFLGSIEVVSIPKKEVVEILPIHFHVKNVANPTIIEPYWNQVLYRDSSVSHTFYFSQTPDHLSIGDIPAFMDYRLWENSLTISIASMPEGIHSIDIPLILNHEIETSLKIDLEGIPQPDHWNAPVLKASNTPEGIEIQITNLTENSHYRLNKYQNEPFINWQNEFTTQELFLDTDVNDAQTYHYRAFSTNHELESGWSNEIVQGYTHLFVNIKVADTTYTNKSSIELTGTATPKATLAINQRIVPTDDYGRFSFNAPLKEGLNAFTFTLEDAFNNTLSKSIVVIRDSTKPDIQFIRPKRFPYYTKSDQVEIQINTEKGAIVKANAISFTEKTPGYFTGIILLEKGLNKITIRAQDKASNETISTVECVRYEKAFFIQLRIGSSEALVNGQAIQLDTPPQILQGRTVVPLRFISEAFGAKVEWIAETKEITIQLDERIIQLRIGSSEALVNGQAIQLDTPPQILQGRTVVPLRFISEAFGAKVEWIAETKEIAIQLYM